MGGGSEFPDHDITKSVSNGSSTASSTTALPLRIITYNIRYAATSLVPHEEAWKKRLPNIQRELYHYSSLPFNPSSTIICLQEVLHEKLNDLARALNDSDLDGQASKGHAWSYVGIGRDDGNIEGEYNPIFYRNSTWHKLHFETIWLSKSPEKVSRGWDAGCNRICTCLVLRNRELGTKLMVLNTHLDNASTLARREGIKVLLRYAERWRTLFTPEDVVLTGDLNSTKDEENGAWQILNAEGSGWIDASRLLSAPFDVRKFGDDTTFTGFDGQGDDDEVGTLDFVHYRVQETQTVEKLCLRLKSYTVVPNLFEDDVRCSDHRAVIVDMLLPRLDPLSDRSTSTRPVYPPRFEAATSTRPIVAIAGLGIETSTFSPQRTRYPEQFYPYRGEDIMNDKYRRFLGPDTKLRQAADWHGALTGQALPGGVVTRQLFDALTAEICSRLLNIVLYAKEQGRDLEGVYFDIHGAMCVEGLTDAEFILLDKIRKVVGTEVLISASMDLHGNVSRELAHGCDLLTCYRTAPHIDVWETKERACQNLVSLINRRRLHGKAFKRPLKAWIPIPILLPGEQTSTRDEPAKGLYEQVPKVEVHDSIIDASIWVGYAWADEPRNRAVALVTGWDADAVKKGAEHLAEFFWNVHRDFHFVAKTGSYSDCLEAALKSPKEKRPFFISDSGDNPTAGGSGDVTWGLTRLLERPEFQVQSGPTVIYASVPGPQAVHTAVKAGVGAIVTITAGAEVDDLHAGPLTMTGKVHAIKHGDPYAKIEVVLQIGSVFAILTELRKPYHKEKDFTDLKLKPRQTDIVIVKIGYLEPELYDMAKAWMLGLTPGGVDQDLQRLGHRHIQRPMWPFDKHFDTEPDLTARFVPAADEVLTTSDE